jgi:thermostable 8-oxoguanine DNA glycosylase
MRHRATARGIEGASKFLRNVGRQQLDELNEQLEQAVTAWLQKHKLASESTKIEAISEHAVPMPHVALRT